MKHSDIIPVDMESEALDNLKKDMNLLIMHTLGSMQAWDRNEATITVKLTINLQDKMADDGKGGMRAVVIPSFEHKINAVMQAKSELKGNAPGGFELVFDRPTASYFMKNLDSNQTTLFDEPLSFSEDDEDLMLEEMLEDDEELMLDDEDLQAQ